MKRGPRRPRRQQPPVRETVRIESVAAGGAGVGRLADGRAVFVHRTAPGEEVRIETVEQKKSFARGRVLEVIEPSPSRRVAPCEYYARCGGCTLEHIEYSAQLEIKGRIVADALERIGGLAVAPPYVVASPDEFRYRSRVSFALRRLRGGRVVAGFHELGRAGRVLDIGAACLLPEPAIADAWAALRAAWGEGAGRLPAGSSLRLTLRADVGGHVALLIEGGSGGGDPEALIDAVPALVAVEWRPGAPAGALAVITVANGASAAEPGELAGGVFLQVNRRAAALLEQYVLELAGDASGLDAVDVYCGTGIYARALAAAGARATGIETDGTALAAAAAAAAEENSPVRWLRGPAEELLVPLLPTDLVITNPPRAGMAPEVVRALHDRPPRSLIYISCDPATLARDLAGLLPVFDVREIRCFDLFPQTAHVETVIALSRTGS